MWGHGSRGAAAIVWATFNADKLSSELKVVEANDDDEAEDARFRFSATVIEFQYNFEMFLLIRFPYFSFDICPFIVNLNNHSYTTHSN